MDGVYNVSSAFLLKDGVNVLPEQREIYNTLSNRQKLFMRWLWSEGDASQPFCNGNYGFIINGWSVERSVINNLEQLGILKQEGKWRGRDYTVCIMPFMRIHYINWENTHA